MKILVAAKHVIDHNVQVRVRKDGSGVETENIKMSLNPFDEVAIEQAIRLKEQNIASEIIALSIGPQQATQSLRSALSLGVDRAILVLSDQAVEPLNVAHIFADIINKEQINLALLGRQSIDKESMQVGQMLSYLLKWNLASSASKIEFNDSSNHNLNITQEIDNGQQIINLNTPAVITCDLRLAEPRFPTMMNIMKAKRQQIEEITIDSFNLNLNPLVQTVSVAPAENRDNNGGATILQDVSQLISVLEEKDII